MSDASEDFMDEVIAIALILDRLAASMQRTAAARIATLRGELARLLVENDFSDSASAAESQYRLDRILAQANPIIFAAYRDMMLEHTERLDETAQLVEDNLIKTMSVILGVTVAKLAASRMREIVTDSRVEGATVTEWWGKQSGDLRFRFTASVQDAFTRRLSLQEALKTIRGTAAAKYSDGLLGPSKRHAEGLVASTVHAVGGAVRFAVMEAHPEYFRALAHISVMDNKTTRICRSRDQKLFALPSLKPIGHSLPFRKPPLHWACRSHLAPVLHPWRDMPEDVKQRVDKSRLSGKPAIEPDLDEWIGRNPQQAGPITNAAARRQLGLK